MPLKNLTNRKFLWRLVENWENLMHWKISKKACENHVEITKVLHSDGNIVSSKMAKGRRTNRLVLLFKLHINFDKLHLKYEKETCFIVALNKYELTFHSTQYGVLSDKRTDPSSFALYERVHCAENRVAGPLSSPSYFFGRARKPPAFRASKLIRPLLDTFWPCPFVLPRVIPRHSTNCSTPRRAIDTTPVTFSSIAARHRHEKIAGIFRRHPSSAQPSRKDRRGWKILAEHRQLEIENPRSRNSVDREYSRHVLADTRRSC